MFHVATHGVEPFASTVETASGKAATRRTLSYESATTRVATSHPARGHGRTAALALNDRTAALALTARPRAGGDWREGAAAAARSESND